MLRHVLGLALALGLACGAAAADLTAEQKAAIDRAIAERRLNEYGDAQGTMYTGGTPLFDETTGTRTDRYEYIARSHPEFLGPPVPAPSESTPPSPAPVPSPETVPSAVITPPSATPPSPPSANPSAEPPERSSLAPALLRAVPRLAKGMLPTLPLPVR